MHFLSGFAFPTRPWRAPSPRPITAPARRRGGGCGPPTGVQYIDELIQITNSTDPTSGGTTLDQKLWAMQDANFNVLGVVDASGVLKERYEYTPYGQRTVFYSPGSNDDGCYTATAASLRVTNAAGTITQPYGLCDIGHQGLMHEEETGSLVYNRGRMLHLIFGRFLQRDPLGYIDGMNVYQYLRSSPIKLTDSKGLLSAPDWVYRAGLTVRNQMSALRESMIAAENAGATEAVLAALEAEMTQLARTLNRIERLIRAFESSAGGLNCPLFIAPWWLDPDWWRNQNPRGPIT